MKRRQFILSTGVLAGFAGCVGGESSGSTDQPTQSATPTSTTTPTSTPSAEPTSSSGQENGPARTPAPDPTTEPGDLTIGDSYKTPNGVVLSVLDLGTAEADDPDYQAALAYVYAKNESGSSQTVPYHFDWVMLAENQQYEAQSNPNTQEEAFRGGEILDGVERGGWVLYAVPENLSTEDLSVGWTGEFVSEDSSELEEVTVRWSW